MAGGRLYCSAPCHSELEYVMYAKPSAISDLRQAIVEVPNVDTWSVRRLGPHRPPRGLR